MNKYRNLALAFLAGLAIPVAVLWPRTAQAGGSHTQPAPTQVAIVKSIPVQVHIEYPSKWQYKNVDIQSSGQLDQVANTIGPQGWELDLVYGSTAVFRKPMR